MHVGLSGVTSQKGTGRVQITDHLPRNRPSQGHRGKSCRLTEDKSLEDGSALAALEKSSAPLAPGA